LGEYAQLEYTRFVDEPDRQARIGQLKAALAHAAHRHEYIVELHQLGVGTTELARLAKMTRSGIDAVLRRRTDLEKD
jgi:hypothetical protein